MVLWATLQGKGFSPSPRMHFTMPPDPAFARLMEGLLAVEVSLEGFVPYNEGLVIHSAAGSNGFTRGAGGLLNSPTFF